MPKGPQGQKRPADVIGAAIRVARIATGEEEEEREERKRVNKLGRAGGKERAAKLSPKRRSEIAREAATRRWNRKADPEPENVE
jgi:hypothetical protein